MTDVASTADKQSMHTPGPWAIKPVGDLEFRRPGEDGARDAVLVAANGICPGVVWDYMREGEANARLIAAAPELLEALQVLLPGLILDLRYAEDDDDKDAMRSRIDTVTEAIKKATQS